MERVTDYSLAAETPREILANIVQALPEIVTSVREYRTTCVGPDVTFCEVTAAGLDAIRERLMVALTLLDRAQ